MGRAECVSAVVDYIEDHLSEKLDLASVAGGVGYSKYHLHRVFADTVGMSIHDYATRRQLTEAAKLLVFSGKPILEIALAAGYESQQAFTAVFKQMYKKTPGEYREKGEFYPLQLRFHFRETAPQAWPPETLSPETVKANIEFAAFADIPLWLDLVTWIIDGFPNLQQEEYLEALEQAILEKRALILKQENLAAAAMVFQPLTGAIDFFGVHPLYRKCGIAQAFLDKVMEEGLAAGEISVTTFREGDKADTGYRKVYQALGFAEAELLTEFGYPTQRMVLAPRGGGRNG